MLETLFKPMDPNKYNDRMNKYRRCYKRYNVRYDLLVCIDFVQVDALSFKSTSCPQGYILAICKVSNSYDSLCLMAISSKN